MATGRALAASCVIPAVAALVIIPVATLGMSHGRFVAPVGASLLIGAAIFGVGMQISNGCGSGVLVAAGQGSRRMWVALPFFCLGGVLGSLMLPAAMRLPSFGAVDFPALLGPWGGLLATEALLGASGLLLLRRTRPPLALVRASLAIGLGAAGLFLVSGEPWGITMGLTLWGAQALQLAGFDLRPFAFWMIDWVDHALAGPVLATHGSLTDVGLLLGALVAAAATGRLRHRVPLGLRGAAGAALGGIRMGVGGRLSFGCNIGSFVGGAASGSLHGFVWVFAALPGCWLGMRLRPVFGMPVR